MRRGSTISSSGAEPDADEALKERNLPHDTESNPALINRIARRRNATKSAGERGRRSARKTGTPGDFFSETRLFEPFTRF